MFSNRIKSTRNLSADAERMYVLAAQAGDETAKEMLISSNIRLVSQLAKTIPGNNVVSFEDLLQEGCLAICTAIKNFDVTQGYRFTTYATFWIKKAIFDCVSRNSTMNISNSNYFKGIKLLKLKNALEEKLRREPTYEEIAVAFAKEKSEYVSPRQVMTLLAAVTAPHSVESMCEEYGDCFANEDDPFESYFADARAFAIRDAIADTLDKREQNVIKMRFGIDTDPMTLTQVGKKLNIEGERVRQIQNKAVVKLSGAKVREKLEAFI